MSTTRTSQRKTLGQLDLAIKKLRLEQRRDDLGTDQRRYLEGAEDALDFAAGNGGNGYIAEVFAGSNRPGATPLDPQEADVVGSAASASAPDQDPSPAPTSAAAKRSRKTAQAKL